MWALFAIVISGPVLIILACLTARMSSIDETAKMKLEAQGYKGVKIKQTRRLGNGQWVVRFTAMTHDMRLVEGYTGNKTIHI